MKCVYYYIGTHSRINCQFNFLPSGHHWHNTYVVLHFYLINIPQYYIENLNDLFIIFVYFYIIIIRYVFGAPTLIGYKTFRNDLDRRSVGRPVGGFNFSFVIGLSLMSDNVHFWSRVQIRHNKSWDTTNEKLGQASLIKRSSSSLSQLAIYKSPFINSRGILSLRRRRWEIQHCVLL